MPSLIWSSEALADVQRLYRFLFQKHPEAAKRAVHAIRTAMQILENHPEVGRPVEGMDPEFREWPSGFGASGYVALYRIRANVALVVAVRHQKEAGYRSE